MDVGVERRPTMDVGVEGGLTWMLEWNMTKLWYVLCAINRVSGLRKLPAHSRLTTCRYRSKIKDTSIAESSALLLIDSYDNGR